MGRGIHVTISLLGGKGGWGHKKWNDAQPFLSILLPPSGCIPHSLSPYPSVEEEQYYQQVPEAPTPPRRLVLKHHSSSALILSWQPSSCHRGGGEDEGNAHIIGKWYL